MVISCCFGPPIAHIYEEEAEREKDSSLTDESESDEVLPEVVQWKRSKKSKLSKVPKKSKSSSTSSKKEPKKEPKKKSKKTTTKLDSRDELEALLNDVTDVGMDDVKVQRNELQRIDEEPPRTKTVMVEELLEEPELNGAGKVQSRNVFREIEVEIPTLANSPSNPISILNESFYSEEPSVDEALPDDTPDDGTVATLTFEVDYTTSTPLFEALELNDWGNVLYFLRAGKFFSKGTLVNEPCDKPDVQVRTWVTCRDDKGETLWRQLPLHAAITLAAPLVVIQRLVELYPDALACPDFFGNLPLNLAAKLHGPSSYIFQVISMRSQRWLQSRQDSEDDLLGDDSTVGTREADPVGIDPDPEGSFDDHRHDDPAYSESPANSDIDTSQRKSRGLEPSGTSSPTSEFLERLRASYDEAYSSSEESTSVDTEFKIEYEGKSRHNAMPKTSTSFADNIEITHVYG